MYFGKASADCSFGGGGGGGAFFVSFRTHISTICLQRDRYSPRSQLTIGLPRTLSKLYYKRDFHETTFFESVGDHDISRSTGPTQSKFYIDYQHTCGYRLYQNYDKIFCFYTFTDL